MKYPTTIHYKTHHHKLSQKIILLKLFAAEMSSFLTQTELICDERAYIHEKQLL